jgi:hypothetical protein
MQCVVRHKSSFAAQVDPARRGISGLVLALTLAPHGGHLGPRESTRCGRIDRWEQQFVAHAQWLELPR